MTLATAHLVKVTSAERCRALPGAAGVPAFDPRWLVQHRPDAHWALVETAGVTARCSLWWQNTPPHQSHRVGLIGHYAAATNESADALLRFAAGELAENGCTLAVGPMDGNTWRDYRFVIDHTDAPSFFLEPRNPPQWPTQFVDHGFREFARYFSAVADDLSRASPRIKRVEEGMEERGVRIRCLRDDRFEADLRQIHGVVESGFRDHLLFASFDEAEFLQQCAQLRGRVPTELVLVAEQSERVVGFCFGVPDLHQAEQGEPTDTVILKTLGVLPGRPFAGLGQLLLERLHTRAQALGYRRVIHALVRESGHLQRISGRYAVPFRRYALFAKELI